MSAKKTKIRGSSTPEIKNRKAYHDYSVGDKYEAGIILKGTEVKSIRNGKAQISDSFVKVEKGLVILHQSHIEEYSFGNRENHDPLRQRQLLLHRKEIHKLNIALEREGKSIIPLRIFFKQALVKIEIAVCQGKKSFDKREALKKKIALREAQRSIKQFR